MSLEKGNMLKADFNPTGKINTQSTDEPGMRNYVTQLTRLGYQDNLNEFYQKVNLIQIDNLIQESFCSELMKKAFNKLVVKRFKELENELEK